MLDNYATFPNRHFTIPEPPNIYHTLLIPTGTNGRCQLPPRFQKLGVTFPVSALPQHELSPAMCSLTGSSIPANAFGHFPKMAQLTTMEAFTQGLQYQPPFILGAMGGGGGDFVGAKVKGWRSFRLHCTFLTPPPLPCCHASWHLPLALPPHIFNTILNNDLYEAADLNSPQLQ